MTGTALTNDIISALAERYHPYGIFWRVNVGVARDQSGHVIRFGLKGQADIAGCLHGRHIEIEVKYGRDRQSQAQKDWEVAVRKSGGIYILARSVEQALFDVAVYA